MKKVEKFRIHFARNLRNTKTAMHVWGWQIEQRVHFHWEEIDSCYYTEYKEAQTELNKILGAFNGRAIQVF